MGISWEYSLMGIYEQWLLNLRWLMISWGTIRVNILGLSQSTPNPVLNQPV